jgi:hypothetical protein
MECSWLGEAQGFLSGLSSLRCGDYRREAPLAHDTTRFGMSFGHYRLFSTEDHSDVRDGVSRGPHLLLGTDWPDRTSTRRHFWLFDHWREPLGGVLASKESSQGRSISCAESGQRKAIVASVTPFHTALACLVATIAYLVVSVFSQGAAGVIATAYMMIVISCIAIKQKP